MGHKHVGARVAALVVACASGGCMASNTSVVQTVVSVHDESVVARGDVSTETIMGVWSSEFESPTGPHATTITFVPDGDGVRGYYVGSHDEPGVLVGRVRDNAIVGTWQQGGRRGPFRFAFTSARTFAGAWEFPDAPGGRWRGTRSRDQQARAVE